jgi:hypothetical protein
MLSSGSYTHEIRKRKDGGEVIKLINPRGRVVEIDDRSVDVKQLLSQGFAPAPTDAEVGKIYNPVFDRGVKGAKEQKELSIDRRATISSQIVGSVLRVTWL